MTEEQKTKKQEVEKQNEDLIILRPKSISAVRKGTELTATAVGWLVWAVLCRPLIIVCLWYLGFKNFYEHMIRLKGVFGLADLAVIYFSIVFAIYLIVRSWSSYNSWKFKGRERRVRNADVSPRDLEKLFNLPSNTLEKAQSWKNIAVDFPATNQVLLRETA